MKNLRTVAIAAALALSGASLATAITVDYTTVADGTYASVLLDGTTVTGSSSVTSALFAGFRGLGIQGGGSDISLDTGESMHIDLGGLSTNTLVQIVDIDPPGNVTFSFEAFDGLTSLGVFAFPFASMAPQIYDLYALSGNQDMTSFTILVGSPSAPLGLQIQAVSFDAAAVVPEPGSVALLGLGLGGLVAWRRLRQP